MLVGCTLSQGQADDHPGAAAWDAVDQQFCANPPGTFLHSSDAEMSNGIRPGGHVEADAVVKGQTASSSYKPAIVEGGVRVMVPPHIGVGTRLVINTEDGTYMERAKD